MNTRSHNNLRRCLDLDVNPGWERQLVQGIDCLACWLDNIDDPLVSPDFEGFTALLVDVRRPKYGVTLDFRRKRDWPVYDGTGSLGCVDDITRRKVQDSVVVSFHADSDAATGHLNPLDPTTCVVTLRARRESSDAGSEKS